MSQLSSYIHNELRSLMKQIQKTPPRKKSSLAKVQELIRTAPLEKDEKNKLEEEIDEVQSAIIATCTPVKSTRTSPKQSKRKNKASRILQMSEDNHIVQYLLRNKIQKKQKSSKNIEQLQQKYEDLKVIRKQKESYLQNLIIKVQRLERINHSRTKSAQKKREKMQISRQYKQKQEKLTKIKEETLSAAKQHRKELVQKLMSKYSQNIKI